MMGNEARRSIEYLSAGSPALDQILGGGLPARSVTVIAGEPGSGKTVFTLQLLFHHARQGRKCLYFTTLAEPALKLLGYMQLFAFFDPRLLDERIVFADLGSSLRAQGPEQALGEVAERAEREGADLVAIDSFKVVHDLLGDPVRSRTFVYDLAVRLAGWGATTFLVGDYGREALADTPESTIADGIFRFSSERQELTAVRQFEVLKLRGADYVTGRHFFEIGADGLTFYPRVRAPEGRDGPPSPPTERLSIGVSELDALLHGGLLRASSTLVQGGPGVGKTLLGLHFLVEGARRGEPGLLLPLEETPDQLRDIARGFGWDLPAWEDRGLLTIRYTSPVELSTDRFLDQARQQMQALGARRVMLDSLTSLALGVPSERRFRELVYALVKHVRGAGVTLMMTLELAELLGSAQLGGHGVASIVDTIVMLRFVEVEAHLTRAISILKLRGSSHETEPREFAIGDGGIQVREPFEDLRGVLTGLPVPAREGRARRTGRGKEASR